MVELGQEYYFLVHGEVVLVVKLDQIFHELDVGEPVDGVPIFGEPPTLDLDVMVVAGRTSQHPVCILGPGVCRLGLCLC